jgi:predicted nucleotidyltransferase
MDKETVIEILKKYTDIIVGQFSVKKVILFGSYARGTAKKDSDIDVAVVVDKMPDDVLASESKLYRLRRTLGERIEPVLLEENEDRSGFLKEILKTGHVIYSC